MKTAEEWKQYAVKGCIIVGEANIRGLLHLINAVQSDAELSGYERGMREAAELLTKEFEFGVNEKRMFYAKHFRDKILSTLAKNKTKEKGE